ncbi:protein containing thioredoxin domain-containing protein [Anaerolinea thermolimosa]|uniref:thioredoxin family protein n=1 Tax=Anaerolinea thermolimosa TaxID=229919 RepID=UPI0007861091|nr:thioredoxin family protein [Anaerolinea thermolimosa]GAP05614.1 protein containing thioredoxin domain-containing protein [Anaerolinea thermolimosa]
MNQQQLLEELASRPHPTVVEFWAPWCAPCRVMAPALEQTAREFNGRVELLRMNADDHPDLLRELRIFGIPTLLVVVNGKELYRRTGALSVNDLQAIFTSALTGERPATTLRPVDRFLRGGAGVALLALAFTLPSQPLLLALAGGALLFSAVYDRCPVYRAVSAWIRARTG